MSLQHPAAIKIRKCLARVSPLNYGFSCRTGHAQVLFHSSMIHFACHQSSHLLCSYDMPNLNRVVLMSDQVTQCPSCAQCNDVVLGQNHSCMGYTFHLVYLESSCCLNRSSAYNNGIFHQSLLLRYVIADASQTLAYQSGKAMGRRNGGVE